MSRGNTKMRVRMSDELIARIEEDIERLAQHGRGAPENLATWLRRAAEEFLAKRARSRTRTKKETTHVEEAQ